MCIAQTRAGAIFPAQVTSELVVKQHSHVFYAMCSMCSAQTRAGAIPCSSYIYSSQTTIAMYYAMCSMCSAQTQAGAIIPCSGFIWAS